MINLKFRRGRFLPWVAGILLAILTPLQDGGKAVAQTPDTLARAFDVDEDYVTIAMQAGTNLREIARKYLDNPDLWPIILHLNGFSDITEIKDGAILQLPTSQLNTAIEALATSLEKIQEANEAGAQLFAPLLIGKAISLREEAVRHKQNGVYGESILLSSRSIDRAKSAREQSEVNRDVEAEARLSDRQGWVEGQKSEENSWTERQLNAVLNEQEKLRTLSSSTAQVVFRDASRLRLNPNSQAVIERMRADPLRRKEDAQISLVEGDFYALLASENNRNRMEVNLPNADAKINSGNFWVSQDKDSAKFSNFDAKPVSVTAAGKTTVLGRNEGTVIRNGEAPEGKVEVQGRVALATPEDGAVLYGDDTVLSWNGTAEDAQFWVEVAFDPRFDQMAQSLFGLEQTSVGDLGLEPGAYYWRVAAIDSFGLPGPMSTVRKFEIRVDETPPFLKILSPAPGSIVRDPSVTITGETETGVTLSIQGTEVEVDEFGRYSQKVEAGEGENTIAVVAVDAAGNSTERQILFTYLKDVNREIRYDPELVRDDSGRFLTALDTVTISGAALADAQIAVLDGDGAVRSETYAEPDGRFLVNVPLRAQEEEFSIRVTSPSGHSYQEPLTARVLDQAPGIAFSSPLPQVTSDPDIGIEIETDQPASVTVNGIAANMRDGKASVQLELAEGPNLIETVATNAVGLVSIDKRTVIFDTRSPDVDEPVLDVVPTANGLRLTMQVGARDASGLAKTSRYRIRSGETEQNGVLRYNKIKKAYQGTVEIPHAREGAGLVVEIEIADTAGNTNVLELVQ